MEYGCDENYRKEVINVFGNERTYLKNLEEIYKIFALLILKYHKYFCDYFFLCCIAYSNKR